MFGKKNSGMSLIEVCIVIVILGIGLSISVPAFKGYLPDFRLRRASADLVSNFQHAKMEAVKTNCNSTVTFGQILGGVTYGYVIYQDADNDLEYDGGERVLTRVRWSDYKNVDVDTSKGGGIGLDFPPNDDGLPTFAFGANGLPRDNAGNAVTGRIYLRNSNAREKNVEIMPTGNIKIHPS